MKTIQIDLFRGTKDKKTIKNEKKEFVDSIVEVINAFSRPKITVPRYEDMKIPNDVENDIFIGRFLLAKKGKKTSTESENMWYISVISLENPLSGTWYRIYMWLFQRWAKRCKKQIPDDLKEDIVLDNPEKYDLQKLRDWIYKKSMTAIK